MKVIIASISSNSKRLRALAKDNGFDPVFISVLKIERLDISEELRRCLEKGAYSWALFTSATAVSLFFNPKMLVKSLKGARFAAVGPSTAGLLRRKGIMVNFTPSEYRVINTPKAYTYNSLFEMLGELKNEGRI